jgi:hypothetical protein
MQRLVVLGTRRIHQGEKLKAIPDFWEIKGELAGSSAGNRVPSIKTGS